MNRLIAIGLIAVMAFVVYSWFINTAAVIPDLFPERIVGSVLGLMGTAGSAGGAEQSPSMAARRYNPVPPTKSAVRATTLSPNYPNPVSGSTTMRVTLAEQDAGSARLRPNRPRGDTRRRFSNRGLCWFSEVKPKGCPPLSWLRIPGAHSASRCGPRPAA